MANQKEIAEHLYITDRQVRRLIENGTLPKSKGSMGMSIDDCRLAYLQYLRHQANSPTIDPNEDDPESITQDSEKLRLTTAQADAQEYKNELQKNESIPADFAVFALAKIADQAVGVLDSLAMNVQLKNPELTNSQLDNVRKELAKAMNIIAELGNNLPDILNEYIDSTT